jgi:hypothetical protein
MIDDEDDEWFHNQGWGEDPPIKGDGICPDCGAPTINSVVADNKCTECKYCECYYTGTIYG